MKKQLFILTLVLMPIMASADAVEIDGIWYDLITKAREAHVVSNPSRYTGDIVIPAKILYNDVEYDVVSIEMHAFYTCHGLNSLVIPASITSIGHEAFWHCDNMTSLTIEGSITSSGNGAFSFCIIENLIIKDLTAWCNSTFWVKGDNVVDSPLPYCNHIIYNDEEIQELIIPDDVVNISECAFMGCKSLTSVTIPQNVEIIGSRAFMGCSNLTSVTLSNGLKSIGSGAFCNCINLTSITIPNSVTEIAGPVFQGCNNLTSITVEEGNPIYDSHNECNAIIETAEEKLIEGCRSSIIPDGVSSIGNGAFADCKQLQSIIIPNSVTYIGICAFQNCSDLISVTIGSGISQIDNAAFSSCRELKDIYCYANKIPNTNSTAFVDSYIEYANLHVPFNSIDEYQSSSLWSNFKSIIALSDDNPQPTGVFSLMSDEQIYSVDRYTISGIRMSKPQRGLNILKMSDGRSKKVIIK